MDFCFLPFQDTFCCFSCFLPFLDTFCCLSCFLTPLPLFLESKVWLNCAIVVSVCPSFIKTTLLATSIWFQTLQIWSGGSKVKQELSVGRYDAISLQQCYVVTTFWYGWSNIQLPGWEKCISWESVFHRKSVFHGESVFQRKDVFHNCWRTQGCLATWNI